VVIACSPLGVSLCLLQLPVIYATLREPTPVIQWASINGIAQLGLHSAAAALNARLALRKERSRI